MKAPEEIISSLKHEIERSKSWGEPLDAVSWTEGYGIIISVNVAQKIVDLLSQFKQPEKQSIEDRKFVFDQRCVEIIGQPVCFDRTTMDFFDYWTEIGDNQKKMRFEKEKVFDIKKRLERWKRNQKNFNNGKPEKRSTESAAHSFITE